MTRWWRLLFLFAAVAPIGARADEAALLRQVVDAWLADRDRWAFTQVVREYEGKRIDEERIERYDPSRGYAERWQLVSIDGREPTTAERAEWTKRKNRKQRKERKDAADNFDFANAKVLAEDARTVRYELPLRSGVEWLFPISKVELVLTIDKSGPAPALKQVQARISEPFRVALGLARILDIDLDVRMAPPPTPDPAEAKPAGTVQAVVTKFGDRVEYEWSDFERVPDSAIAQERERARASE